MGMKVMVNMKAGDKLEMVMEWLRYAGVANIKDGVLTISEPKGVDGKIWAKMNSERIRSFGNSACAVKL